MVVCVSPLLSYRLRLQLYHSEPLNIYVNRRRAGWGGGGGGGKGRVEEKRMEERRGREGGMRSLPGVLSYVNETMSPHTARLWRTQSVLDTCTRVLSRLKKNVSTSTSCLLPSFCSCLPLLPSTYNCSNSEPSSSASTTKASSSACESC